MRESAYISINIFYFPSAIIHAHKSSHLFCRKLTNQPEKLRTVTTKENNTVINSAGVFCANVTMLPKRWMTYLLFYIHYVHSWPTGWAFTCIFKRNINDHIFTKFCLAQREFCLQRQRSSQPNNESSVSFCVFTKKVNQRNF